MFLSGSLAPKCLNAEFMESPFLDFVQFVDKSFCVCFVCMHGSDHTDWLEKKRMTCLLAMNLYVHVCGCVIEEKSDRNRSEFRNTTTHICFSLLSPQRSQKWLWLATYTHWNTLNENIHTLGQQWNGAWRFKPTSLPTPKSLWPLTLSLWNHQTAQGNLGICERHQNEWTHIHSDGMMSADTDYIQNSEMKWE